MKDRNQISKIRGKERDSIKILEAECLCPQANAVPSAAGCHTLIASTSLWLNISKKPILRDATLIYIFSFAPRIFQFAIW